MTAIEKFYFIKDHFKFRFHGIDMSRVMIFEMWDYANGNYVGNRYSASLTYDLSKLRFDGGNEILSTFGQQNRRDHKEVYDYVMKQLGSACSYNDLNELKCTNVSRPFTRIWVVLRCVWGLRKCSILTWRQRVRFACLCCKYCNSLLDLERLDLSRVKKYLSMYHVDQLENLITQYMKKKGIPTYSLCEGMYVVDKKFPTLDSVNYRNFETDHCIVWGQYVIDSFIKEGISADRMVVGGYPHEVMVARFNKQNVLKRGVVLLARRDLQEANEKLINVLLDISDKYEFTLKLHPNSDRTRISGLVAQSNIRVAPSGMTVGECFGSSNFDFAVVLNTTAYYESLMRGVPCVRFWDGVFVLMPGCDDVFTDAKSFFFCMNKIEEDFRTDKYQKDVDALLSYTVGVGINNYKKILLKNHA